MTERNRERRDDTAETVPSSGGHSATETAETTPSADVREVIGRRGYDEGEDETANEEEEH